MSDVKALIAEARRWTAPAVRSHVSHELLDTLDALADALEASVRAPAVDREALALAIRLPIQWDAAGNPSAWMLDLVDTYALVDVVLASGILQDAAEVEARGLEAFGFWLLDIGHMNDLGRANMKFLVEQFARAQQVREGDTK